MASLNRRQFLRISGASTLGVMTSPLMSCQSQPDHRPNVLFIMTDQQRFDALSYSGNPVVQTPNLDRLAREGAYFSDATCISPICGVSRAGLLTGQLAHKHGCHHNTTQFAEGGLLPHIKTYDEILHAAGYHCDYFGKWHTGRHHQDIYDSGLKTMYRELYHQEMSERYNVPESWDNIRTFVDMYTDLRYRPYPVDLMIRECRKRNPKKKKGKQKGDGSIPPDNALQTIGHRPETGISYIPAEDSLTAWTVKRTIDFLKERPDAPFSVTCSILNPHGPLIIPESYANLYDPKKMPMPQNVLDSEDKEKPIPKYIPLTPEGLGQWIATYYALVTEVDHWVGELMKTLEDEGYADNTLVIFTTDHGELMGNHGRLGKSKFYEEAWRVPLIMRYPGVIPAGQKISAPATGIDLAPTILDFCGSLANHSFAGDSLKGLATAQNSKAAEFAYGEYAAPSNLGKAMRSQEWKFVIRERTGFQLFDLQKDPLEVKNLLSEKHRNAKHMAQAKKLYQVMTEYLDGHGDDMLSRLPVLT